MLDSQVLVLNRVFQAVQVTSVRKAFSLFYKGHVKAVLPDYTTYEFDNWCDIPVQPQDEVVLTPSMAIRVPRVIALKDFDRLPPSDVKFSRHNIYLRDGNRCQYCGHSVLFLGALPRPRDSAFARRDLHLGERRVRVPLVQRQEGQPNSPGGPHAPGRRAAQAAVAPGRPVRVQQVPPRVAELRGRGLLEYGVEVSRPAYGRFRSATRVLASLASSPRTPSPPSRR
jgi:DNA-directed RNA polymerase subunit RPC12/RpoP